MDQQEASNIEQAFEEIIGSCDRRLLYEARKGEVYCSIPRFLISKFKAAIVEKHNIIFTSEDFYIDGPGLVYRGIKFVPGYDKDVIVYHDSYWQYQESWMINRVPTSSFIHKLETA